MRTYSVAARGLATVEVQAANWITALGSALERLGHADIERLACEMLPNGTVIARDITTGTGYVVQPILVDRDVPFDVSPADSEALEVGSASDALASVREAETHDDACAAALEQARDLMSAESGAVLLQEDGALRFVSVVGPNADQWAGLRVPLGTGVAGYAMSKRRAVVLGNATDDPRHDGGLDRMTGYITREIGCIPVVKEPTLYGVVEVLNLPQGRRFTRHDIHQLHAVAHALAARLARP
jgi:putative methionine-R-sulfoxide reductase with GAF domain